MGLLSLNAALQLRPQEVNQYYRTHVNPKLLSIYKILGLDMLDVDYAEGVEVYLLDGRTLLDFTSSMGVLSLGHNHPRILAAERVCHEKKVIDVLKIAPHKLQAALAFNLAQLLPDSLKVAFFAVSGAEAVEAAMKLCERVQGHAKTKFITTTGSFHGKTHGALSLTTSGNLQDGFLLGVPKEQIIEIPFDDVKALEESIVNNQARRGGNSIIALIVEPIQGQGVVVPKTGYLKAIVEICRQNNILVIFDEIKVGMFRAGTFCAFQHEDITPDVITLSKALGGGKRAISAMITTDKLFKRAYGKREDSNLHSTTFGGFGESCAVAIESLNVMVEEDFSSQVKEKGDYLFKKLLELKEKYPKVIKEISGRGLFLGLKFNFSKEIFENKFGIANFGILETVDKVLISSVMRELYESYNILTHFIPPDLSTLHIMPPLIVSYSQLDVFVRAIEGIVSQGLVKLVRKFMKNNLK